MVISNLFSRIVNPQAPCFYTLQRHAQNENSGSINLLVTNSAATYSYSWSNGVVEEDLDSLGVGEYIVIVTDTNGCQAIASTQVEEFTTTSFAEDPSTYGASDGWAILMSAVVIVIRVIVNTVGILTIH